MRYLPNGAASRRNQSRYRRIIYKVIVSPCSVNSPSVGDAPQTVVSWLENHQSHSNKLKLLFSLFLQSLFLLSFLFSGRLFASTLTSESPTAFCLFFLFVSPLSNILLFILQTLLSFLAALSHNPSLWPLPSPCLVFIPLSYFLTVSSLTSLRSLLLCPFPIPMHFVCLH